MRPQRDRGIEVRARDRTEGQDQRHQHGAGREGVREERDRDVPAREPLTHDARADDAREQQRRPDGLGREPPREGHADRLTPTAFSAGSASAWRSASTRAGTRR